MNGVFNLQPSRAAAEFNSVIFLTTVFPRLIRDQIGDGQGQRRFNFSIDNCDLVAAHFFEHLDHRCNVAVICPHDNDVVRVVQVYAPPRLDIGADSPAKIADSMISEILIVLRDRTGGHLRDGASAKK